MTKKAILILLALIICVISVFGCSPSVDLDNEKINIVCTVFPAYDWLNEIIGERSELFNIELITGGEDLHSFQPTAEDIAKIHTSDLVVYIGGASDVWIEKPLKDSNSHSLKLFDCIEKADLLLMGEDNDHNHKHNDHTEEEFDEHIWLSLRLAETMVERLCEEVSLLDSKNAGYYESNAEAYKTRIKELDDKYTEAVSASSNKSIIFADRFPFRYMAEDYGINCYAAFSGCSADIDAGFETVVRLAEAVKDNEKSAVLVLENSNESIAKAVIEAAEKPNTEVYVMNSCQSIVPKAPADMKEKVTSLVWLLNDADYIEIMTENLASLKEALK